MIAAAIADEVQLREDFDIARLIEQGFDFTKHVPLRLRPGTVNPGTQLLTYGRNSWAASNQSQSVDVTAPPDAGVVIEQASIQVTAVTGGPTVSLKFLLIDPNIIINDPVQCNDQIAAAPAGNLFLNRRIFVPPNWKFRLAAALVGGAAPTYSGNMFVHAWELSPLANPYR